MLYSGIDQHKRMSVITTVDGDGRQLAQVTVPNDRAVLRQYFAQFPGPHAAVVEATSRWYWLRDLLARKEYTNERNHAYENNGRSRTRRGRVHGL